MGGNPATGLFSRRIAGLWSGFDEAKGRLGAFAHEK